MSHYDSEHGSIKLPAGAMKAVRSAVVTAYNESRTRLADKATALLPRLLAAGKRKRNFDWREAIYSMASGSDDASDVMLLLMPTKRVVVNGVTTYVDTKKPKAPKKKDLGLLGARAKCVEFEDGHVSFGEDGRTVTWSVSENNHAVESARESAVGRAFFRALANVSWTRGSGGTIIGNDEYNRDSDYEGGGGNYVTSRFGPLGNGERPGRRNTVRGVRLANAIANAMW